MVLKIHGNAQSTCTQRILTTLAEKGITDFELINVDLFKGAQKQESFISLQPFGKVPVLDDDGFLVFESRAICKYLAVKYQDQGNPLIPRSGDLKGYALFEQGCSIEQSYFDIPAYHIAFQRGFQKMRGLEADEAKVAENAADLDAALAGYEKILSKQAYLAGNEFSLADLFHLPYGTLVQKVGFQSIFDKYPSVKKWFETIEARESWKKATSL